MHKVSARHLNLRAGIEGRILEGFYGSRLMG
jgi:hypothetical protein